MSGASHLSQLIQLGKRRQDAAATALGEARTDLLDKQRILDEQQALIASLREEIAQLDVRRATNLDVESVSLATARRRWLVFDLEKEVFYIDMMVYDVDKAEEQVANCRREWIRLGERVKALQAEDKRVQLRGVQRRESRAEAEFTSSIARTVGAS